jgi:protocatechuate 3,4-dioxygenase beta subunit
MMSSKPLNSNSVRIDRRQILETLGALSLIGYGERCFGALTGETDTSAPAIPACVVTPTATEGPYFVDDALNRSDLTAGTRAPAVVEGVPLALNLGVFHVSAAGCVPLVGAQVDLWHADAAGVYSNLSGEGTRDERYLRGYQLTDSTGAAHFTTIYPGWYRGRTPHIHFKVRGQGFEFTSQWYFDDVISDQVFARPPYSERGARSRRNGDDFLFERRLLLTVRQNDLGPGYLGAAAIGLKI